MKTSWWRCERKTSGDLTPELWSPLGNFNLSGGAGFSVCQVLFHSPCWGTRSSAEWCWIMWLIAEEVSRIRAAGEKFEVAGWLIAIWKRQRDAVILIPRSLTHCLVDFSFFTVLDSCFLLFTILSSIPSVIPFLSSPPHFFFKPPELALDCWR